MVPNNLNISMFTAGSKNVKQKTKARIILKFSGAIINIDGK